MVRGHWLIAGWVRDGQSQLTGELGAEKPGWLTQPHIRRTVHLTTSPPASEYRAGAALPRAGGGVRGGAVRWRLIAWRGSVR
ncbi:MAG: hypothetical protein ACT4NY_19130 [Pseudonocardiales bacterium]